MALLTQGREKRAPEVGLFKTGENWAHGERVLSTDSKQNKTKQNKTRECAVEPRCHCSAEGGAVCHLGKRLLTVLMVHGEVVENTGSFKL